MPKATQLTPDKAKKKVMEYARTGRQVTETDLALAEKVDAKIRAKVRARQERQTIPTESNQPFPFPEVGSLDNPSLVKPTEPDLGSNRPTEEKTRYNKKQKEYYDFVEKRLGPFIEFVLWMLIFGDYERAEWYAPTPEECRELAPHVARIAPKLEEWFHVPQWAHDVIVTSDDSFSLIYLVVRYMERTGLLDKALPKVARMIHRKPKEVNQNGMAKEQSTTNGNNGSSNGDITPDQWAVYGIGAQYQ